MPVDKKSTGSVAMAFAAALLAAPALTEAAVDDGLLAKVASGNGVAHELCISQAALHHLEKTAAQVGWWPFPRPWKEVWLEIGPVWVESIPPPILTD